MSKWRIEFRPSYQPTPVSFWVHRHLDHEIWTESNEFAPPLPHPIPGKGFAYLIIDAFGTDLEFGSVAEAEHVLKVLSQKHLPSTLNLSKQRGSKLGPNQHWLSRLPAHLKSWTKRKQIIAILQIGLNAFREII